LRFLWVHKQQYKFSIIQKISFPKYKIGDKT